MQFTTSKKVAAALGAGAIAVAASGVAYAYWTASGVDSGEGNSATAASAPADTTIVVDTVPTGLYPTGSDDLTFHLENSNPYPVYVGATDFSVDSDQVTADNSDCTATLAALSGTDTETPARVPAKTGDVNGKSATYTISVAMDDTTDNQSACQGATFTIPVVASPHVDPPRN